MLSISLDNSSDQALIAYIEHDGSEGALNNYPDKKEVEYIEVDKMALPNGKTITFSCRSAGPTIEEVMQKVYAIASESLKRKLGIW